MYKNEKTETKTNAVCLQSHAHCCHMGTAIPAKASCAFWHPGIMTLSPERQSVRMSKIVISSATKRHHLHSSCLVSHVIQSADLFFFCSSHGTLFNSFIYLHHVDWFLMDCRILFWFLLTVLVDSCLFCYAKNLLVKSSWTCSSHS